MKQFFIVLLALVAYSINAQDTAFKRVEIGLSIGNNGQLESTFNDFYVWGVGGGFAFSSTTSARSLNMKMGSSFKFRLNENVSLRLKVGFSIRKDQNIRSIPVEYSEINYHQKIINLSSGLCFEKKISRFEVASGMEIPVFILSDMLYETHYKLMPDSINISQELQGEMKADGGFVYGVNNFVSVKYFFNDNLGFGGEINYGLLFANIGGEISGTTKYIYPSQPEYSATYAKKYKKVFFSPPELSITLILRF